MELPSGFEPLIVELQSTALPAWLRKQVNIIYQNYKNESIFLSLKGHILNFLLLDTFIATNKFLLIVLYYFDQLNFFFNFLCRLTKKERDV